LDGSNHRKIENKQYDDMRTEYLNNQKVYVMRFYNSMIENDLYKVVESILKKLKEL
jgi:very-short-patch-repair endonuclease